ncbi:MAG: MBL fold metallo-hydrolase [Candidatus Thorarchaeota archaeon]
MEFANLKALDSIEVTAVVDNSIELWSNPRRDDVQRFFQWKSIESVNDDVPLVAGVGLSLWIRMSLNGMESNILLDTGESTIHMSTNLQSLGLPLNELDGIVLSHGHDDHYGGLRWVLENCHHPVLLYLHPRMIYKKGATMKTKEGERIIENRPILPIEEISKLGGIIISNPNPILLSGGMLLRTGEIPRVTDYEEGRPGHLMMIDGKWEDDSKVLEDVSLVAKVKGRGLVVISGCSHAGIVNIAKEASRLTGESRIHAIIGGLHLAGSEVSKDGGISKLSRTVSDLKLMEPSLLVPCHCTGWRARHEMSVQMKEAYVEGSVGNRYSIKAG